MDFNFSLTAATTIHAYFSVIDPTTPEKDGYEYVGLEDLSQLNITLLALGTTYFFQTPPFEA